jgi:hypothetical protein
MHPARAAYNAAMARPFDVTLAGLPPTERAEVEQVVRDRPGAAWISDQGDGMAWHLLFALAAIGGIVATLVSFTPAEIAESYRWFAAGLISPNLAILGFTLAVIALPLLARDFFLKNGRHGWMVTSFGLVRIRGPKLRVVRWPDIERITRRRIGAGTRKFVIVELATARGVLECDTGALYAEIKRRAPTSAVVVE